MLPAFERIDKGKLSLCFKRNGNIVFTSKAIESRTNGELFGTVQGCSGLFEDFRGLTNDLTLMTKNLFHVIFKTF